MFARVAASKGSSPGKSAKTAQTAARVGSLEPSAQQAESAQAGSSNLAPSPWDFGSLVVHAPSGRNQPVSSAGSSPGAPAEELLSWPLQAKLAVGAPDDPLEREADRVAEQVMRMPDPGAVARPAVTDGGDPGVQRMCSCGGACSKCRAQAAEQQHGDLDRKAAAPNISSMGAASPGLRRAAPPIVGEVLRSLGEPLPSATRAFFEPKLAFDLGRIRVHADQNAAKSAHAMQARAYTVGPNIVFGARQYQPGTAEGRRLLAHELTHSIQQSAGSQSGARAVSSALKGSANTRVMRAPPTTTLAPRIAHPSVAHDIEVKFGQFYAKLSPKARYRLNRNITIAIGVVTEESDRAANSPRWVYTLSGNASSKEIDAAAQQLGLTRWQPSARTEGRGGVGAPNDAEQLLTEGAEANHFDVWGVGVNRKVCADCHLHLKDAEIPVQAYPDGAFRKGGQLYGYQPAHAAEEGGSAPAGAGAGGQGPTTPEGTKPPPSQPKAEEHPGTPAGTTTEPAQPQNQGGNKPTPGPGGTTAGEHEGGETTPAPRTTTPGTPSGGAAQVGLHIGVGIASVGLSWLAAYLKARVDQKIAQRQIDAFLDIAKKRINANPDDALKKMMFAPEVKVYAWVYLDSAVITTFEVNPGSLEPSVSDSSPMFDLARIGYEFVPVDPSMVESFPRISGGGRHITTIRTIVIDLPLQTPSIEDMLAYAKTRGLPLDGLLDYAMYRFDKAISTFELAINTKGDLNGARKEMKYWQDIVNSIRQSLPKR